MNALVATVGGAVLFAAGVLVRRRAYALTRFEEILDAVGSRTRASGVEPAEWNVTLTEMGGSLLAFVGGPIERVSRARWKHGDEGSGVLGGLVFLVAGLAVLNDL